MMSGVLRILCVSAAGLLWLAGCNTTAGTAPDTVAAAAAPSPGPLAAGAPEPDLTSSVGAPPPLLPKNYTPSAPNDDLSLAKENFRQGNYGLAEHYFRRSVEAGPREAEAWLGLAASYDRLRRFDLADRAYQQLLKLTGPVPSVLNNIGFSYMLRGEFKRARETLLAAQAKDPDNAFIRNNLVMLEEATRKRQAIH